MSLNNFIPTIWSANLITALQKTHVFGALANTDYEGEIRNYGDTVKINSLGDVTIGDYTKNQDINAPETLTDGQRTLSIDKAKYFNFQVDDVDSAQQNPKVMQEAMKKSAYALNDVVDSYFASLHAQAGLTLGSDVTAIDINSANAIDVILEINEMLNNANVPKAGRYFAIPAWFETKLILAQILKKKDNTAEFQNGLINNSLGFDFYSSNNSATVGANSKIMVGVKGQSYSFAQQIKSVEAYRPEKRFADAVKGLHLWGGKVLRPEMTLCLTAKAVAEV